MSMGDPVKLTDPHRAAAQRVVAQLRSEDVPWMDIFVIALGMVEFLSTMTKQPPHHLIDNALCGLAQLPGAASGEFAQGLLAALREFEIKNGAVS
jgi:hypothetical protein